jgi:NAD(P)-dependent dehydrogenase (short-subunit alcohol dehydrogenase family)
MQDVKGKVAVVTGAASGIGLGIAQALARAEMRVVVADIEAAAADKTASNLRDTGGEAIAVPVDVADPDSVEALADAAFRELGAVHVVCNNAGVIVGGPLEKSTAHDWEWLLGVNVMGVVNGCRTFAPRLRDQGQGGHIVNTASVGGLLPAPGLGVYCTTKFAVVGFTASLRQELAPDGIGVSTLCPGGVRTNLLEADRNRPGALSEVGGDAEVLREMLESGMAPAQVGECVLRGIQEDAAYIFSHPEFQPIIESRFQEILAGFQPGRDGER